MAVLNTGRDDNQTIIKRAGTPVDANITSLGANTMQYHENNANGTVGLENDGVLSRDSDAPLGNRINQRGVNWNNSYKSQVMRQPSGYTADWLPIEPLIPSTHNPTGSLGLPIVDEEAHVGYNEQGKYWNTRQSGPSGFNYGLPT